MYKIRKTVLFQSQILEYAEYYKDIANIETANGFLDDAEASYGFIAQRPLACISYKTIADRKLRKWKLKNFPMNIYFSVSEETIILEAIYAHKMNVEKRLSHDIEEKIH